MLRYSFSNSSDPYIIPPALFPFMPANNIIDKLFLETIISRESTLIGTARCKANSHQSKVYQFLTLWLTLDTWHIIAEGAPPSSALRNEIGMCWIKNSFRLFFFGRYAHVESKTETGQNLSSIRDQMGTAAARFKRAEPFKRIRVSLLKFVVFVLFC